jgi:hypothetical protein
MCTYATLNTDLEGSAKGPAGAWFKVTHGTVCRPTTTTLFRDVFSVKTARA